MGRILLFSLLVRILAAETITGTVTGYDGKPLDRAMVILRDGAGNALQAEYATEGGRYRLRANAAGLYLVQFIGSFHENLTAYFEARGPGEGEVRLDAQLATHQYQPEMQPRLFVYGDPALNQKPFSRQADGTWVIEIETIKPELVVGISGAATTGGVAIPDSAEYRRQFNRMLSVLRPQNGKIRVVLDSQRFPRSDRAEEIAFSADAEKRQAIQNACVRITKETQRRLESERRKAGITRTASPADGDADLELLQRHASQQEEGPLREVHWLLFLVHAVERADADPATVRRALDEVPARSPFWALAFEQAAKAAGRLGAPDVLFAIAAAQATPALRVEAYRRFLWSATPSMRARLLDRMMEEFPAHHYTKAAVADYSPAIRPGRKVPDFQIPSLDDPTVVYQHGRIGAGLLLIDFWATWCGPCVAEMPNLQKVYAAFKPKGLEILSVSLDESREVVRQFRAAKFSMPWLHGMDAELKAFESKMASDFGVYGVPRAFLVDQNGTIVALGSDLQGQNLEAALARFLGVPPRSK